jgi:hypothetical protein
METHYYTCEYCKKQYVPKRRIVQKFCSTSCRVRQHQESKKLGADLESDQNQLSKSENNQKVNKIDKVSIAGVANSALGTAIVDASKRVFTKEENWSATKGDIWRLENRLQRYHKINNMKPNSLGQSAYFDLETAEVVFRI